MGKVIRLTASEMKEYLKNILKEELSSKKPSTEKKISLVETYNSLLK